MTKEKTARLIPNAIQVCTDTEKVPPGSLHLWGHTFWVSGAGEWSWHHLHGSFLNGLLVVHGAWEKV